jgi:hypothetical protein
VAIVALQVLCGASALPLLFSSDSVCIEFVSGKTLLCILRGRICLKCDWACIPL